MIKNKRILGIIPARAGSKGIKNKNIIDLCGKPLIAYSIEEGNKSKYIDKLIVSTDGEEITKVAKKYNGEVPFIRPKELAEDNTKTIDVMIHAIDFLKKNGEVYDYVVLLQPTQPLRKWWQIDEAIEKIINENGEGLVSVCEVKEHPVLVRRINKEGFLENLLEGSSTIRRQDMGMYYKVNGVIYINKINKNLNANTSLNDNKIPYVMRREDSIDIDEVMDLKIAEAYIKAEEEQK